MPQIGESLIGRHAVEYTYRIGHWYHYAGLLGEWKDITIVITGHTAQGVKGEVIHSGTNRRRQVGQSVFIPLSQFGQLTRIYSLPFDIVELDEGPPPAVVETVQCWNVLYGRRCTYPPDHEIHDPERARRAGWKYHGFTTERND